MKWNKEYYQRALKTPNLIMRLKFRYKQFRGKFDPPVITPYLGFGSEYEIFLTGSLVETRKKAKHHHGLFNNIKDLFQRYWGIVYPFTRIKINAFGVIKNVRTDKNGQFETRIHFKHPVQLKENQNWYPVHYQLLDYPKNEMKPIKATGSVLLLNKNNPFGIVSDIDDTIIVSHATNQWQKFYLLLVKNAKTRVPFHGVSAFYTALEQGANNKYPNPVFYVSNSDWNLYDLISEFCRLNEIPKGPILMNNFKKNLIAKKAKSSIHDHKQEKIRLILELYPNMSLILIGDSGQHDPEIYTAIAKEYPERIKTIYIRNVGIRAKIVNFEYVQNETAKLNIPMILVRDSSEAAKHAARSGFIHQEALAKIRNQVKSDENRPSDIEQMISD